MSVLKRAVEVARLGVADPRGAWRTLRHARRYAQVERALSGQRWAMALFFAHRAGLFAALGDGATIDEAARATGLHPNATDALLRILAAEGWVEGGDRWKPTAFATAFLAGGGSATGVHMLSLAANQAAAFGEIEAALRTGRTPAALDVRHSDAGQDRAFLAAVNGYLWWAARDLIDSGALPEVRRFIVGSMGVSTSALLLRRYGGARVTYGCLPHLVREIPRLREEFEVPADRVDDTHEHGGAPEDDDWGGPYDLVFLTRKMILMPEERVGERFATKAREVLAAGGAAVFWDIVHPDVGPAPLGRALEAVWDLCASPGAPVRTERRWRQMLGDVGYRDVRVVAALGGQTTFVVATR